MKGEILFARVVFTVFFVLLVVGSARLSREYIFRGAPDRAAWRDLRLWALLLVVLHLAVYWWF